MEDLTLVSRHNAQMIKAAKLVDEREVMVQTKITRLQRGSETAGQEADLVAKSVITAALFGFYSVPTAVDFVITLRDDTLILVRSPRRGGLIKKPTVRKDDILRRVEINKSEIVSGSVEQTPSGRKLYLGLSDGFTLSIDVPNKIIAGVNAIVKELGYLDCWM